MSYTLKFDAQVKEDQEKSKAALKVKNNLSVHFLRYGVVKKACETNYIYYSFSSPDIRYPAAPANAPALPEGYAYAAFPIRGGYLYAYYETENKWAEYKMQDALKLRNIVWEEEDYKKTNRLPKKNPKTGTWDDYTGLPVGKNKVVWVAWSEVQWAPGYATKVLTTEELRKGRMQRIDIGKWKKEQPQGDVFKASEVPLLSYKSDYGEFSQLKEKITTVVRNEEEQRANLFLVLNDPMGAADDITGQLTQEYEYLDALVACAMTGTDPQGMKKWDGEFIRSIAVDDQIEREYAAAYSVGFTLYMTLFNRVKGMAPNAALQKYRDKVSLEKLKALLGVEKRAAQRRVIYQTRDALGAIFQSNYYQNVLYDYTENSDSWRIEGETRVTDQHYGPLSDLPHYHDQHLDHYNEEYQKEDPWRKFIMDSFTGEELTNARQLLSPDFRFSDPTGQFLPVSYRLYFKDYTASSIASTAAEKINELLGSLSAALGLYGPYASAKPQKTRLFAKLNKLKIDGKDLVIMKETTIEALNKRLEERMKEIRSSSMSKKKKEIQRKRLSQASKDKIAGTLSKFTAQHAAIDVDIQKTKVEVMDFLTDRKKLTPGNNKAVDLLGNLLVVMDVMNVGSAIKAAGEELSTTNVVNAFGTSMSLASSALSLSTQSMRTLDLKLTRLLFKNVSVRLSTRLAWPASIASAVVDGISAYERAKNHNTDAALFYALSAVASIGLTIGAIASTMFSLAWGGPVAWACLVVGLVAGAFILWLENNDFESYLANSIFGKDTLPKTLSFRLFPNQVMWQLHQSKERMNKELQLSDRTIDMSDFAQMDTYLRDLFFGKEERCDYKYVTLHKAIIKDSLGLGSNYAMHYLQQKLHFSSTFAIPKPAPVAAECKLYLYLACKINKSALINISPERNPEITRDDQKGLYTFSIHYPEVHQKAQKEVCKLIDMTTNEWYRALDKDQSCYILTYRIYVDANDKEKYMPHDQEWYVMSLPFVGYQKTGKNSYNYDSRKVLKPKLLRELDTLIEKHELITW